MSRVSLCVIATLLLGVPNNELSAWDCPAKDGCKTLTTQGSTVILASLDALDMPKTKG